LNKKDDLVSCCGDGQLWELLDVPFPNFLSRGIDTIVLSVVCGEGRGGGEDDDLESMESYI